VLKRWDRSRPQPVVRPLVGRRPARVGGTLARDIADRAQRRAAIGTGHGSGPGLGYFVAHTLVFGRMIIHTLVGAGVFGRVGAAIHYNAWAPGGRRLSLPPEAEIRPRRPFHRRLRRLQLGRKLRAQEREAGCEAVDRRMAPGMAHHPRDLAPCMSDRERVQRIVYPTPRPETVAEPQELHLGDRRQDCLRRGLLDDFVLDGHDAEWSCAAIWLRNVHPPWWRRPVASDRERVEERSNETR